MDVVEVFSEVVHRTAPAFSLSSKLTLADNRSLNLLRIKRFQEPDFNYTHFSLSPITLLSLLFKKQGCLWIHIQHLLTTYIYQTLYKRFICIISCKNHHG